MMSHEQEIRELKEIRGKEWSKGKKGRDMQLIQNCHNRLNEIKAILNK
jgi:hypothetical protein